MATASNDCFGDEFPVFVCFRNNKDKEHQLEARMTNKNLAEENGETFPFHEGDVLNPIENAETLVKYLIANGICAKQIEVRECHPRNKGSYMLPQRHVLVTGSKKEIDSADAIVQRFSSDFFDYSTNEELLANAVPKPKSAVSQRKVFPAAKKVDRNVSFVAMANANTEVKPAVQALMTGSDINPAPVESAAEMLARKQRELKELEAEIEILKDKAKEEAKVQEKVTEIWQLLADNNSKEFLAKIAECLVQQKASNAAAAAAAAAAPTASAK